jgi:hypothetical protein
MSQIAIFTGFQKCFGFVDGTSFPLHKKPLIDPQDYFSREGNYGLAALVVCDDEK